MRRLTIGAEELLAEQLHGEPVFFRTFAETFTSNTLFFNAMRIPGTDRGVVHVCSNNNRRSRPPSLAVDDDDVLRIRIQPVLDLLANGAEPVKRRRKLVRPAKLHHRARIGTSKVRPLLGDVEDLNKDDVQLMHKGRGYLVSVWIRFPQSFGNLLDAAAIHSVRSVSGEG